MEKRQKRNSDVSHKSPYSQISQNNENKYEEVNGNSSSYRFGHRSEDRRL